VPHANTGASVQVYISAFIALGVNVVFLGFMSVPMLGLLFSDGGIDRDTVLKVDDITLYLLFWAETITHAWVGAQARVVVHLLHPEQHRRGVAV
jgi:hypothetical protein